MVNATGRVARRRTAALAAVALTLGLLAGACGSSDPDPGTAGGTSDGSAPTLPSDEEPDAGPPQPGGKLAYGLVAETNDWSPATGQWAASGHQVAMSIYDRLGALDDNQEVKPFLATSIEPNADFTEWTIGVRPDIEFHNGDPVDAAAIAANLTAFKNGTLTGTSLKPVETITASPDGTTVVVKMNRPFSTYPLQLTSQTGVIAWPGMFDPANTDAKLNPIGSGPFVFEDWEPGAKLTVAKNNDYWRDGLPYLDEIEFQIIVDNQARQASLKSGTVDVAQFFDIGSIVEFRDNGAADFSILRDTDGESEEVLTMFNTAKEGSPLVDPKARRALALGTDVEALALLVGDGELTPQYGPFKPNSKWYAEGTGNPTYDPDEAKKLVEEVKAENGGVFEFTLLGTPVVETQRVTQGLQQQWQAIGVTVNLEDTEQATLINRALTGDYEAVIWRQFGSAQPDGEYVWTTCENIVPGKLSLNFAKNCDEAIDAALGDARATDDFETQKAAYKVFQERLAEDIPYLWLWEASSALVVSKSVHDITKATLPGGEPANPMTSVVHQMSQVWIDH